MTTRRQFLKVGAIGTLAPAFAFAQSRPVKIGMLGPVPLARSVYSPGVVRRLAELGYRDGAEAVIEYRSSDGVVENYAKQARELIDLRCDLIIPVGTEPAVRALHDARAPMPVVFLAVDYDPLEKGVVASLRRPDRNTTGVYLPQNAMVAKRLEIMREVVPAARRYLVFSDLFTRDQLGAARKAASAAGLQLTVVEFSSHPYDFQAAFEAGRKAQVQAFMTLASPPFTAYRNALIPFLAKHRLPSISGSLQNVEAGYLLGFNVDVNKVTRRVAEMGVSILKGAKPEDIPVEQADEFELTINAKIARALGVKIPESVRARATRIVQ